MSSSQSPSQQQQQTSLNNHRHHHHHHHQHQSHHQSGTYISRHSLESLSPGQSHSPEETTTMDSENSSILKTCPVSANSGVEKKCSFSDLWKLNCPDDIAQKLTLMTQAPRICHEMREDGILPLLVQLLHQHSTTDDEQDVDLKMFCDDFRAKSQLRRNSSKALRNIVNNTAKNQKEIQILSLLEDLRSFVEVLALKYSDLPADCCDHPCAQLSEVFQIACDQDSKKIIELFGGVYVILDVIQTDYRFHSKQCANQHCVQLRQCSLNVLTYLTCNNANVKSLLGSMRSFISMLVDLLKSSGENLTFLQSVANVFHNLSWKTDYSSKQVMRDCEVVKALVESAINLQDQVTLNSVLEPLLNLTAHSTPNKSDFCRVESSLDFLVSHLVMDENTTNQACALSTRTRLAIVENAGGILRNISSFLSSQEPYLQVLRAKDICSILMEQLKSPSLVIVSNACITLSNLTLKSSHEQTKLIEIGAVNMLQKLTASKHKTIQVGSSKTLKNLLANLYSNQNENKTMKTSHSIPSSLHLRRMKGCMNDVTSCLNENFDKILTDNNNNSPILSPTKSQTLNRTTSGKLQINSMCNSFNGVSPALNNNNTNKFHKVQRSSSHDSIGSTHSEPAGKIFQSVTSSFVGESKSSAQAAAAFMNLSSTVDQRMVNSYSGQTLNSIYATLPANSRIREQSVSTPLNGGDSIISDVSDYDMSCSDISCIPRNMNNSIVGVSAGGGSNSFLEAEPQDPEPTDYSQRFKEQLDDDFTSNRSVNKADVNSGCEDTVKVYQTENTPLAFSLAPSLTDLREIGNELNEKSSFQESNNCMKSESFHSIEMVKSVSYFKKPNPPPKPGKFPGSSSAFCLKSINEEENLNGMDASSNTSITPSRTPNYRKVISRDEMDFRYSQFGKDSQFAYATEDTPAIFSHATSLSSLSVDDDGPMESMVEGSPQQSLPIAHNNSLTNNDDMENAEEKLAALSREDDEDVDDDVFHDSKIEHKQSTPIAPKRHSKSNVVDHHSKTPGKVYENVCHKPQDANEKQSDSTPTQQLRPINGRKPLPPIPSEDIDQSHEEDDYDFLLAHCVQYALPKSHGDNKQQPSSAPKVDHSKANSTKKSQPTNSVSNDADDDDDDFILNAMQFALPKHQDMSKKQPAKQFITQGKQPRVYKRSGNLSSTPDQHQKPNLGGGRNEDHDDEDDDFILNNAMQFALPKHDTLKKNSKQASMLSPGSLSASGKSPRVYKRNPNSSQNSHQHHAQHISSLNTGQEQCRQFHVEDTPVHFSTIHSSLSSLIESDDEILDQQLLDAAIKFDASQMSRAKNAQRQSNGATHPEMYSTSNDNSDAATLTITSNTKRGQTVGRSAVQSDQSTQSSSRSVTRQHYPKQAPRMNNDGNDDAEDDERTYTICTQSSRLSSGKQDSSTLKFASGQSSMGILSQSMNTDFGGSSCGTMTGSATLVASTDLSSMAGSMLDFDQIQPPSIMYDSKIMQNSYDSGLLPQNHASVPHQTTQIPISKKNSVNNSNASPSMDSFLDNQKPPSLMEKASLMSYSSASINDEIPDIDHDGSLPVVGGASSNSKTVANAAFNCAKEVNAMTDSVQNLSISESASGQRNDKTFDLEPNPNGTLSRNRSNLTITTGKTSSTPTGTDTRTYNKNERQTQNTLTKGGTSTLREKGAQLSLDDSDTDISENLPFDEPFHHHHHRNSSRKHDNVSVVSSEMYSNPMSSKPGSMLSVSSKPPPPKPPVRKQSSIGSGSNRTESKCSAHSSSQVEHSEDPYFSDPDVISPAAHFGHSLASRKSTVPSANYFEHISASQQIVYPQYGGGDSRQGSHHYPEQYAQNFHSLGRNCGRNDRRVRPERDFEDKDFMLTPNQRMQMLEREQNNISQMSHFTNNTFHGTLSKYCDPNLIDASMTSAQTPRKGTVAYTNNNNNNNSHPHPTKASVNELDKPKNSKGLLRKITSSLSSHNIGERTPDKAGSSIHQSPMGNSKAGKDVSSKKSFDKINSKISSLWKRSKSSHDKLDQEALTNHPGKNTKAMELNRTVIARRSYAKQPFNSAESSEQHFVPSQIAHSPSIDNATFSTFGRNNNNNNTTPNVFENVLMANCTKTRQNSKTHQTYQPHHDSHPADESGNAQQHQQASNNNRKTCLVTTV